MSTKDDLMRAAIGLFAAQGVAETTTREIAAAAGVSEGTIYRHFAGKEQLVAEILGRHYAAFATELDGAQAQAASKWEKLRAIVRQCYAAFDRDPDLFTFLLISRHEPMRRIPDGTRTPVHAFEAVLARGIEDDRIGDLPLRLATRIALGMVLQPAIGSLDGEVDRPLLPQADAVAAAIWRALSLA